MNIYEYVHAHYWPITSYICYNMLPCVAKCLAKLDDFATWPLRMTSLLGRLERESAGSAKLSQFGRSLRSPIDVEVDLSITCWLSVRKISGSQEHAEHALNTRGTCVVDVCIEVDNVCDHDHTQCRSLYVRQVWQPNCGTDSRMLLRLKAQLLDLLGYQMSSESPRMYFLFWI